MRKLVLVVCAATVELGCAQGKSLTDPTDTGLSAGSQTIVVTLTPASVVGTVGSSVTVLAGIKDAQGNVVTGQNVAWSSMDTAVATVSSAGVLHLLKKGSTQLVASTAGDTATAPVTVDSSGATGTVAAVTITPASATLAVGGATTLTATVLNGVGAAMSGQTVTWSTSKSTVATVKAGTAATAVVTAAAVGSAVITATTGGKTFTATVTVSKSASGAGAQAAQSDAFVNSIGVNGHLDATGEAYGTLFSTAVLQLIQAAGIRHWRDGLWYNMASTVASNMNALGAAGCKLDDIMLGANITGTDWGGASSAAAFVKGVVSLGNPAYVEAWEGYNEPNANGESAAQTLTGQSALYAAVKSYNSGMLVYGPALSQGLGLSEMVSFISGMSGIASYMDHPSAHPYAAAGGLPASNFASNISQLVTEAPGDAPIFTEMGYYTMPGDGKGIDQVTQAKYALRSYLEAWNAGAARAYIYEWVDDGSSSSNSEDNYGLVLSNGTPKPSYTALKNLIALTTDPGSSFTPGTLAFTLSSVPSSVHHALFEKRNGTFVLVIWNEVLSYNTSSAADITNAPVSATLTLGSAASEVQQYIPTSGSGVQQTWSGVTSVSLSITDSPMVLEITP
jgi:hypothetical protein